MNLSTLYQLPKDDVNRLISAAEGFLRRFDVTVHLTNLDRIVETEAYRDGPDVYAVQKAAASDDEHHETCISDGLEVWLHGEIDHPGGECSRLYDLLHVGCGHFFQWSADATSGLSYFGDEAWGMASRSFLRASEQDIQMVWKYEYEAARLATGCLNEVLESGGFDATLCSRVKRMFNDYAATDLEYITRRSCRDSCTSVLVLHIHGDRAAQRDWIGLVAYRLVQLCGCSHADRAPAHRHPDFTGLRLCVTAVRRDPPPQNTTQPIPRVLVSFSAPTQHRSQGTQNYGGDLPASSGK